MVATLTFPAQDVEAAYIDTHPALREGMGDLIMLDVPTMVDRAIAADLAMAVECSDGRRGGSRAGESPSI